MARLNDETGVDRLGSLETDCRRQPEGRKGREAAASTLDAMKGRTDKEGSDHVEDIQADTASWRGKGESRHDGSRVFETANPQDCPKGGRSPATMGTLKRKP